MWITRTEEFTAIPRDAETYLKQLKEKYIVKSYSVEPIYGYGIYRDIKVVYEVNVDKIVNVTWKEVEDKREK